MFTNCGPNQVSGLQYLEKMIHIPFCVPRLPEKVRVRYVDGLLNLTEATGENEEEVPAKGRRLDLAEEGEDGQGHSKDVSDEIAGDTVDFVPTFR